MELRICVEPVVFGEHGSVAEGEILAERRGCSPHHARSQLTTLAARLVGGGAVLR
jgi:hypothetical protein